MRRRPSALVVKGSLKTDMQMRGSTVHVLYRCTIGRFIVAFSGNIYCFHVGKIIIIDSCYEMEMEMMKLNVSNK